MSESEINTLYNSCTPIDGDWIFLNGCSDQDPIFHRGKVAIGTMEVGDYDLTVNGITRTKEIEVIPSGWSDYVLDPNYDLPQLSDLEKYIFTYGHLPDIPSEQEVLEDGIEIGALCAKLLAKIEELTLYQIQQHKIITTLIKEKENKDN